MRLKKVVQKAMLLTVFAGTLSAQALVIPTPECDECDYAPTWVVNVIDSTGDAFNAVTSYEASVVGYLLASLCAMFS